MLLANLKVIKQDIASKIGDVIGCLKLFNDMYAVHRSALEEIYVDPHRKAENQPDQMQVWNEEDFQRVAQNIAQLVDDSREDNLACIQLISDFQDRGDIYRYKNMLLPIASKFEARGVHATMDENWIKWIRGLLYSSQVWSDILGQRLVKCVNLFEDISELIFLSDKAFPFLLDNITRLSHENKLQKIRLEDQIGQWKDLSQFLKGMELRLNHLRTKLSSKWIEGAKETGVLLEDVYRLKKMVSFLWGEASATIIYKRLADQILELTKTMNKLQGDKNSRYNRSSLAALAEKVFNLVVSY